MADTESRACATVAELDILRRICVSRPYFALTELASPEPGVVTAVAPVEMSRGQQALPLAVAEAGRHLAIQGLCAVATLREDGERAYSLARSAVATFAEPGLWPARMASARVEAAGEFLSRRRAAADTHLLGPDGQTCVSMRVEYDVLPERLFHRLFGAPSVSIPAARSGADSVGHRSPYVRPLALDAITRDGRDVVAETYVSPQSCAGHFDGNPFLPVAIACAALSTVTDLVVGDLTGSERTQWVARSLSVQADGMVPAGQTATFRGSGEVTREGITFSGSVAAAGEIVTTANVDLVPVI